MRLGLQIHFLNAFAENVRIPDFKPLEFKRFPKDLEFFGLIGLINKYTRLKNDYSEALANYEASEYIVSEVLNETKEEDLIAEAVRRKSEFSYKRLGDEVIESYERLPKEVLRGKIKLLNEQISETSRYIKEYLDYVRYSYKDNFIEVAIKRVFDIAKDVPYIRKLLERVSITEEIQVPDLIIETYTTIERLRNAIAYLILDFYKKDPQQVNNISTISFVFAGKAKELKIYPKTFSYHSEIPIEKESPEFWKEVLNAIKLEIDAKDGSIKETKRLIERYKSESDEYDGIIEDNKRKIDALMKELNRKRKTEVIEGIKKQIEQLQQDIKAIMPTVINYSRKMHRLNKDLEELTESRDKFNAMYKELKENLEKGDYEELNRVYQHYLKRVNFNPPPIAPLVSWWLTDTKDNLLFPSLAKEYQYFFSLYIKWCKEKIITSVKPEFYNAVKYLPKFPNYYKRHIRYIKNLFQDMQLLGREQPEQEMLGSGLLFRADKLLISSKVLLTHGKIDIRERLLNVLSALELLYRSLDFDFRTDVLTNKPLNIYYTLKENEILPFPDDWQPYIYHYDKEEIKKLADTIGIILAMQSLNIQEDPELLNVIYDKMLVGEITNTDDLYRFLREIKGVKTKEEEIFQYETDLDLKWNMYLRIAEKVSETIAKETFAKQMQDYISALITVADFSHFEVERFMSKPRGYFEKPDYLYAVEYEPRELILWFSGILDRSNLKKRTTIPFILNDLYRYANFKVTDAFYTDLTFDIKARYPEYQRIEYAILTLISEDQLKQIISYLRDKDKARYIYIYTWRL